MSEKKTSIDRTTQDSIEALEALLKIRESNAVDRNVCSGTTPIAASRSILQGREGTISGHATVAGSAPVTTTAPTISSTNATTHASGQLIQQQSVPNLSFLMNSFPSNVQSTNRAINFQLPYPTVNPQHLANVAAAATFTMPTYPQPHQHAPVPSYSSGMNPSLSKGLQLSPVPNPTQSPLTTQNATTSVSVANPCTNNKCTPIAPSVPEETPKRQIRKSEIEAALKSKPQRGRKRENLSGLERQELTRTRNREHAKTTRIRKKARYEELVSCEQKYLEMLKIQEIDTSRRESLVNFMSARSGLLKSKAKTGNCNDTSTSTQNSWNFSFEPDSSSCRSEDMNVELSLAAVYSDTVMDCSSFVVDVISGHTQLTEANLASLQAHDNKAVIPIKAKLGNESNFAYEFKIKGAQDGVFLSANDDGLAECEFSISLQTEEERQLRLELKTDFVRIKYAKNSHKIASMKIFTVSDEISSFSLDNLRDVGLSQVNFPSVVSLEQSCLSAGEKTL